MAGRIPQYFIDDLLARTDVVDVVSSVVKLKKSGRNWHGLCPFHNEKTPSFTVSQEKQFYHCFGCGAHGNAVGFLMEHDHMTYVEAIEDLARQQGLDVPREESEFQSKQRKVAQKSQEVMELSAKFYQDQLHSHPQQAVAQAYLNKRGLNPDIINKFGIGYAPEGWDNLKNHLLEKTISEKEQVNFGLLVHKEETGRTYDRFRHRIMFPIKDWRGKVIAFGGRVLGDEKPKYLNSPETQVFQKGKELYGLYEARTASGSLERLMVVEGYMDVVALSQAGINYAVATLGTSATADHMERLFKLVPEVVFCFDGDAAGLKAAERALDNVLPFMIDGRQARFLFLPEGEDPDSLVGKVGKNLFEQRVVRAAPLSEYLFWQLQQGLQMDQPEAKAQLKQRAIPLLQRIPKGLLQTLLVQKLAGLIGVSEEHLSPLLLEVADAPTPRSSSAGAQSGRYESALSSSAVESRAGSYDDYDVYDSYMGHGDESGSEYGDSGEYSDYAQLNAVESFSLSYAKRLLTWLVHQPAIWGALTDEQKQQLQQLSDENLSHQAGQLMKKLVEYLNSEPKATTQSILAHWYGTPEGELLGRVSVEDILIPAEMLISEFQAWLHSLEHKRAEQQRSRRFDELTNKSRSGQALTQAEKQELVMLIQAQHAPAGAIGQKQ
ncbi:DNA primase [Oceanospirillum beijerinckii]|uniref:DNA primase n=1 Tax=Oceanospirillum beijerinckii TaxID=64976 RepID=UPI00040019B2|nr:DNA primase [Oceanospirillum beijerinckii]